MEPMLLSSTIDAVTVYRTGALVTRVAQLPRQDGEFPAQIRLGPLPLCLDDDSVKARVEVGPEGGTGPLAAELRIGITALDTDVPASRAPAEQLLSARQDEERLISLRDTVRRQIDAFAKIPFLPRRKPGRKDTTPTGARLELLELQQERLASLRAQIQDLEEKIRLAMLRRMEIQQQIAQADKGEQTRRHQLQKTILVVIRAAGATAPAARLLVEYFVPGARWAPAYAVRLNADLDQVALAMRAHIRQRTGEDWTGVRLSLSTASPTEWTELPELPSLRLGRQQPEPRRRGWRTLPVDLDGLYADYDHAFHAPPPAPAPAPLPAPRTPPPPPATAPARAAMMAKSVAVAAAPSATMRPPPSAPSPAGSTLGGWMGGHREAGAIRARSVDRSGPRREDASAFLADEECGAPPEMAAAGSATPRQSSPGVPAEAPAGMTQGQAVDLTTGPGSLRYGQLLMDGRAGPHRGRLRACRPDEIYAGVTGIAVRVDVTVAILQAVARAQAGDDPVPEGLRFPEAVGGYDYAYPGSHRLDIPSDGLFHSVGLWEKKLPVQLYFVTVPRETTDVFRLVKIVNPLEQAPLLPGPAEVHVGDQFLMTFPVKHVAPGGALDLGLGVEQGIKVARNSTFSEHTSGLIGGKLELRHSIQIDLMSHLARPAHLQVRERLPVPGDQDQRVEVKCTQVDPPWEEFAQDESPIKGAHCWWVDLAPGESRKLRAGYSVHISSGDELVAGNRREA